MLVESDLVRDKGEGRGEVKGCWPGWLLKVSCSNLLLRLVVVIL